MNGEITETPLVPQSPTPKRAPKLTPRRKNPTGNLQSKGGTSPSLTTNNKPVPNYLKTTSHSCHDSCKYGKNHNFESKWTPPVRTKRREGIRGVVLNPELRTGKIRKPKKPEFEKSGIEKPEEDPEMKDIHELEMIIPPEKVFNLFDESSPVEEITGEEYEIDDNSKSNESVYDGLSLHVVGSTSFDKHKYGETVPVNSVPTTHESVDSVPVDLVLTEPVPTSEEPIGSGSVPVDSGSVPVDSGSVPIDSGSIDLVSIESVRTDVPASTDSVPIDVSKVSIPTDVPVSIDSVPKDLVKKKNTGKQIVKSTGTGTKGENAKKKIEREKGDKVSLKPSVGKKIEREKVDKASLKPSVVRKKGTVQKDRTNTVPVSPKEKKVPKVVKKPPVKPVPSLKLRKLNKQVNGATSSMENNPSDNSNYSDSTKEKTIYVVEPKPDVKKKSEIKKKPRNPSLVQSGGTKPPLPVAPHKMAFRRGKIVNVQNENPVPVRIRFRRVQNDKGQTGTVGNNNNKGVRKKRENGSFGTGTGTGTTPPTVVLRRQTGTGDKKKSEAQGLFNDVIEETASKLVETRKSKVKALVGAFETVISLQEK